MTNNGTEKVIVGIDGSPGAMKALQWAERYAEGTGADLTLINAWQWPTTYGVALVLEEWDPEIDARKTLEKARAELHLPDERVHIQSQRGFAPAVLAAASREADLLVVGSRGHGSLTGALLGSVSSHCVHHAHCPVVVVR